MIEKTGYRIASFNIEKFGENSVEYKKGKNGRKDLETIAQIIRDNQIDIVAIQEISHQYALKLLLEKLSSSFAKEEQPGNKSTLTRENYRYSTNDWDGCWAKPVSVYSDKAAEGYAFIWNRHRIKLVTNYKGEEFEPRIGFNLRRGKLVRPPFIGRFMPIKGRFEFRIINAHFAWATPKSTASEELRKMEERGKKLREEELQILLDTVYVSLAKQQYDVNNHDRHARPLEPYTFLVGDYNLNLPGKGEGARMSKKFCEYKCGDLKIITVNGDLTTLKQVPSDPDKAKIFRNDPMDEHHLANNYDHFSYDQNKFESKKIANPVVNVIAAYETYDDVGVDPQTKFDLYKEKVSDHLPIILDVDIRQKRTEAIGG